MIQKNQDKRPQAKGNGSKPEIRDNLDARKNEEYPTKGDMKKAEIQDKEKQKSNKSEE
jgi:hypothetical protein